METRVAVLGFAPQRIPDQVALARDVGAHGGYRFRFVVDRNAGPAARSLIAEAGFEMDSLGAPAAGGGANAPAGTHLGRLKARLKSFPAGARLLRFLWTAAHWNSPAQYLLYRRQLRRLEGLYAVAVRTLAEFRPDVVLAFGDRHGDEEAAFLKAARTRGVPVIIPYMALSDIDSLVEPRLAFPLNRDLPFAPLFNKWVFRRFRGQMVRGMLYYSPPHALAYHRFGTLPTNAWTIGCGPSDVVCVDNRSTFDRYLGYGVPESRLRIVGDSSYNSLHEAWLGKEELISLLRGKYGCRPGRRAIVLAVPQFAEHDQMTWERHWEEIGFLMRTLDGLGQNLLLSLHPKMDRSKYAFLEREYACRVLDERLVQVLPAADLFVAGFSSTVIWAVLSGVKSVVMAFHGIDSDVFGFLSTPDIVRDRARFAPVLAEALAQRHDFADDWRALSRNEVFDGRTVERYRELLSPTRKPGSVPSHTGSP